MPFDSQGNFTRVMNWQEDAANSIPILASRHDDEDDNFANGFNEVMCRNGRTQMTGQLKMGSNKIVGLATGTADTDAVNKGQLDSALSGAVAGKQNTITGGASSITSSNLTTNRALISNGSGKVAVSAITSTELGYLDNATGNIQTQLDGKQATITGAASTIASSDLTASRTLVSNSSGKVAVSSTTATELGYVHGVTSAIQTQLNGKQATLTGGATTIASSNLTANKALVSNSSGKVAVSSVTSTELGYVSGVTSAIQTQLNGKQPTLTGGATTIASSNLTKNRTLVSDDNGKVAVSSTTSTELGYVHGVTSAIQTQINSKQATITGGATTIASSDLTVSRALISNSSGKVAVSSTTSTELGYVHGVTSNIQTQLNNRPTSTDIDNILKALYPVGAIYIGTQTTCPLSTLISGSTWTLVSAEKALWTGDGTNGNTTINAGLPNITGYFDYAIGSYHDVGLKGKSGAFTKSTATRTVSSYRGYDDSVDSATKAARVEFDASSSNAIYGGSSTVQPPAYVVNVWRRTA